MWVWVSLNEQKTYVCQIERKRFENPSVQKTFRTKNAPNFSPCRKRFLQFFQYHCNCEVLAKRYSKGQAVKFAYNNTVSIPV